VTEEAALPQKSRQHVKRVTFDLISPMKEKIDKQNEDNQKMASALKELEEKVSERKASLNLECPKCGQTNSVEVVLSQAMAGN